MTSLQTPSTLLDSLPTLLEDIFSFSALPPSYPAGEQKERHLPGTTPFTFYDQHTSKSQSLKHVALLPSIKDDILRVVDDRLAELRRLGEGPLPLTDATRANLSNKLKYRNFFFSPSPQSVASQYAQSISSTCLNLVSSWVIHPQAPKYYQSLWFDNEAKGQVPRQSFDDPMEHFSIRFIRPHKAHPNVLSSVDDDIKGALLDWCARDLFTFLFLPLAPHTEALLRDLDRLATLAVIPPPGPTTRGCPFHSDPTPTTCDAENPLWSLPLESRDETAPYGQLDVENHLDAIFPGPPPASCLTEFEEMKNATAEGILHHVWNMSLKHDTTIIVINTGHHERICIRHRATRTLYLSDIIETTKPGYGKIHLGLQMTAVLDALDRYRQQRKEQPIPIQKSLGKRPRKEEPKADLELRRSMRHKMNVLYKVNSSSSKTSRSEKQILWNEIEKRPIALLRFCDGHLQSSVPSCCIQRGGPLSSFITEFARDDTPEWRSSYRTRECFSLVLTSAYGDVGASGKVFKAQLEIVLANGQKISQDVVAKLTTHEEGRKRMRHEYQVYQRLWQHNVKRIPEIYGLFQDHNDLVDVLVMERARFSFRQREPWKQEKGNVTMLKELTPSDKNACIAIVKAMHKADVVHRDLRPENLVIAQDGKPMVIDFDQASLNPSDHDKKNEMEYFRCFMDGKTVEDHLYG
ncbi:hypothetical protein BDN72DRAFT_899663 [Pluteus cervinus]|uniref:Uncharacterized protein n=1 Tax=Pluteus cervinus TaxID=181527 RepID=A0ACD3ALP9_9AGAR|nr:hypothetical protein BDN72DRAFT_899663 [Pluteus cervinus]